ncbi:MAG: pitrilysin family protein [Candidatus Acidiferrum sp.]
MRTARKTKLILAVFVLGAMPAVAQKQTPPTGGPPKPFTVPTQESYTLRNGMKVTLVPYGNLPKVTVTLMVRAGTVNQPVDAPGLAKLAAQLMKEGTTSRSAKQVADEAADMGGTLEVWIDADQTGISSDVLSEFAPKAAQLIADVVEHPLLPESELPRLKNDALRQLAVDESDPQNIAEELFRKILYPDHPYGVVFPTKEGIDKTSVGGIKKFYSDNFGAARAHLYVAGRFDATEVKKAIAERFENWASGPAPTTNVPDAKPHHVFELRDRPGAEQSTLLMGLPVPGPNSAETIPLAVTNALLGGSFGSRITSNIREQKGYTYSPYSDVSTRYHNAYWAEAADVTTQFTGPSLKEIFGEITRLQNEAPGEPELKGIETYLSGLFVIRNSSRGALITQLNFVDLQGLGNDYLKNWVQNVNAVTPEQVQGITQKYIRPNEMTIVVVGDKAKIAEQIAPFQAADK